MKRFILTGTPGCGKTSIIRALELMGYSVISEAATDVIAYEQMQGHEEPWKQKDFIDKIVTLQKQRQIQAADISTDLQFYDRSPICTYALAIYLGFEPPSILLQEIKRADEMQVYQRKVFFIENLGFCKPTKARRISFEESLVFEKIHDEAYAKFGYECVRIPPASQSERVNAILSAI